MKVDGASVGISYDIVINTPALMRLVNQGREVQVDPIKPMLKAPGSKRVKLQCDILLATSAFKFNLRC